jgi:hypothetical protein
MSMSEDEKMKIISGNTLAFNVVRYYWHIGRAIRDLLGKSTIELDLGSIINFGDALGNCQKKELPTKFQRITLSNIPDYVGMHIVFLT